MRVALNILIGRGEIQRAVARLEELESTDLGLVDVTAAKLLHY